MAQPTMKLVTWPINEALVTLLQTLGGQVFTPSGNTWALTSFGTGLCADLAAALGPPATAQGLEQQLLAAFLEYLTISQQTLLDGQPTVQYVP